MAQLLDGKAVAREVRREVGERARVLVARGVTPGLALVRVGDDPASESYVRGKARMCKKVEIRSEVHAESADIGPDALTALIESLNARDDVHGILLQLPLPKGYEPRRLLDLIRPEKDVDGLTPVNAGKVVLGLDGFVPCTPLGVQRMLMHYDVPIAGRHVVVVGRSSLVGRPLANLLSQKGEGGDATVTLCHSRSRDLPAITRTADILVAAAGLPQFITADMVADGAVVVDVGIHRLETPEGNRLVGDVAFDEVEPKVRAISPVPGGVGPMTVAMLLWNTMTAAERACPT